MCLVLLQLDMRCLTDKHGSLAFFWRERMSGWRLWRRNCNKALEKFLAKINKIKQKLTKNKAVMILKWDSVGTNLLHPDFGWLLYLPLMVVHFHFPACWTNLHSYQACFVPHSLWTCIAYCLMAVILSLVSQNLNIALIHIFLTDKDEYFCSAFISHL